MKKVKKKAISTETKEVLGETLRITQNASTAVINIIKYLSTVGSEYKAFNLLSDLFKALEWILEVFEYIGSCYEDEKIIMNIKALMLQINNILFCMENEDYVLLCDVLEADILPILEYLNKVVDEEYLWEN
ncbi:MAG: hypothetical protein K0Q99_625 [Clostridia bacterium]|nr:hypothetical protein [Clostridia bacterium]